MIVLSVGMPRAGSGWYYNLTNDMMLTSGAQDARQIRQRSRRHTYGSGGRNQLIDAHNAVRQGIFGMQMQINERRAHGGYFTRNAWLWEGIKLTRINSRLLLYILAFGVPPANAQYVGAASDPADDLFDLFGFLHPQPGFPDMVRVSALGCPLTGMAQITVSCHGPV